MAPDAVVIDTNVVLDCWLFEAPGAQALRLAVEQRRLRWELCAGVLDELQAVLARPVGKRWETRREHMLTARPWQHADLVPSARRPAFGLLCTDPDDQKFLDLALERGARWLVTRDKALLRLKRRAAAHGLAILQPEQGRWPHEPQAPNAPR